LATKKTKRKRPKLLCRMHESLGEKKGEKKSANLHTSLFPESKKKGRGGGLFLQLLLANLSLSHLPTASLIPTEQRKKTHGERLPSGEKGKESAAKERIVGNTTLLSRGKRGVPAREKKKNLPGSAPRSWPSLLREKKKTRREIHRPKRGGDIPLERTSR